MKNEISKVLRAKVLGIMLALVLAISVIASVNSSEAAAKKSKIKLSSSKVTVVALKTTQLTLKNGTKKIKSGVKWSSSNKKIATVNRKGLVTAKTPGKVKITATYKGKKYVCNVTVKAPALKLNK
ncbi:MAG: Ig-like domain-containing protein, partial [Eubacterium sp.]|nr:Ig-like domain-containing protein [Eubacterium sp.]